jgi:hypothetical protein
VTITTGTVNQPDIMDDIRDVLRRHYNGGGCTEEGCGCPGSQLQALYERLVKEFPDAAAPAGSVGKEGKG